MHWFYVEESQIDNNKIKITGSDVNHIKNVLRMDKGEYITICDGLGKDYYCSIDELHHDMIIAKILEINTTETELKNKIYLFQGIPKKDKMELIIQKAVELGVHEIIPVAMKRCVAKIEDGKKEQKKLERWQAISTSAAKQSGRGIIPNVHHVLTFSQAIEKAKELECVLIPYEQAEGIASAHNLVKDACGKQSIGIFIGPEGGFDDQEIQIAQNANFHPITLGKRILRTETAGLTMLSILMFESELQQDKSI